MAVSLGLPETVAGAPLPRRLAWVIGARLVLLTALLALVGLANVRGPFVLASFTVQTGLVTLIVAFALAGVYAWVLKLGRHHEALADVQLVFDQLTWSVVVYLSGGPSSGATSFYGLTCLTGAILTGFRGASIAAVTAGAGYSAVALSLYYGWLPPPRDQPAGLYAITFEDVAYHGSLNALILAVVTMLGGYLAERLRLTGGQLVVAEQRAEQAERLAALGRLATGLAHEIRNPLGSISGSIQLLRTSPELSDEDRELCDIIQREAGRLDDLVSDMMHLAKRREPDPAPMDLAASVREVVALAGRSGRGASDVSVRYDGAEQLIRDADAAQFRQLVWNLVRNAVQASSAGSTVSVTLVDDERGARLSVADEGPGIDEEARARLFDAFFTTRSKGTGVGLAVVKQIADEHGFAIRVNSEHGRGAEFVVWLDGEPRP